MSPPEIKESKVPVLQEPSKTEAKVQEVMKPEPTPEVKKVFAAPETPKKKEPVLSQNSKILEEIPRVGSARKMSLQSDRKQDRNLSEQPSPRQPVSNLEVTSKPEIADSKSTSSASMATLEKIQTASNSSITEIVKIPTPEVA